MAAVVDPCWYTVRPFEQALDEFRAARLRTLRLTGPLSQAQLDFAAGPEKWSVSEVMDHLIRTEKVHRSNMEKLVRLSCEGKPPVLQLAPADLDINFAFVSGRLAPATTETSVTIPSEFMTQPACEFVISHRLLPFRTAAEVRPQWGLPVAELRARLLTGLENTAGIFHGNREMDFRELICQDPLLGAMNVLELLHFMASHETGHQAQIREIVNSQ